MSRISRRIARSPLARPAAMPQRLRDVGRHNGRSLAQSATWLVNSREHTNYTYDLTERNRDHLAWWVAQLVGSPVAEIRSYLQEIMDDQDLREHVQAATKASPRWRLADPEVRLGRRIGWYAIVRAVRPEVVVETGTDKGLGSCVFASALLRNGTGSLLTLDTNVDSGYLVSGRYASVTDRIIGDSVDSITQRVDGPVDLFIHDSLHTYAHETSEFNAVAPKLSGRALVLSDNAHETDALLDWAEQRGRSFQFFREEPEDHWWPGEGIGVSAPA